MFGEPHQLAFVEQHIYERVYRFKPSRTKLEWDLGPSLRCYVSLPIDGLPMIVLSPLYWGDSGRFGLRKVAITINGKLAFEKAIAPNDIVRGRYGIGQTESTAIVLSSKDLAAFRQLKEDTPMSVRLTGARSSVEVSQQSLDQVATARTCLHQALHIHDRLGAALAP